MKRMLKKTKRGAFKYVWKLEFIEWIYLCGFMFIVDYVVWECIR